ncbi:MAG: enoyl-CoA hydratase/isomerase family protein [Moraxella osloensis]
MKLPTYDSLLLDIDQHVATITLNRPDKRNAFNDEVIQRTDRCVSIFCAEQDEVRAVVLTANGKAFCAGADLNWMRAMADYSHDENLADAGKLAQMLATIYHCPKPTVAAIQGDVYAGGMGLVAACDIAISVKSNFCLSEVKLGLIPATISPYVIRAMGARAAHRYFLSAEVFDAKEAKKIGFIHERVDEEEFTQTLDNLVKHLVNASPNAVKVCKKLVQDVAFTEINEQLIKDTVAGIADIRASAEGKEGVQSFLQKRKPSWSNN